MENEHNLFYHPKLNAHTAIGIDIDSTLIEGPCSHTLQNWVKHHHDLLDLHLITFRTGTDFDRVAEDISGYGLHLGMFKGLHGIDRDVSQPLWDLLSSTTAKMATPKFQRHLSHKKVTQEMFDEMFKKVAMWKGSKCAELGLTALVDDLQEMVVPGCHFHNVTWIDALDL